MNVEVLSLWSTSVARVPLSLTTAQLHRWRDDLVAASEVVPSWRARGTRQVALGPTARLSERISAGRGGHPSSMVAAVMEVFSAGHRQV